MRDCRADIALAERAAEGDETSWRAIFEATCDRLFAFLCYQIQDRDEARDLLQETYMQAFRRLRGYRGEAPLEVWMRRIALRKAIDWKRTVLRRRKRTVSLPESLPSPDAGEPLVRFRSEREALNAALASLSRVQRAVLLLREMEGWSFREIAAAVGGSEAAARVQYGRARLRMRRLLQSTPQFHEEASSGLETSS